MNAQHETVPFKLPPLTSGLWRRIVDTTNPRLPETTQPADASYELKGRSMAVFRLAPPDTNANG
jgi:hypothetical protein